MGVELATSKLQSALAREDWLTILSAAYSKEDFLLETTTSLGQAKLLHVCAYTNNVYALKELLSRPGANPNVQVSEFIWRRMKTIQRTPLHFAAAAGHVSAIHALVAAGANLDGAPVAGEAKSASPLHTAVAFGHEGAVEALLYHGASIESRSDNIVTPTVLMTAVRCGKSQIVERLLTAKASVDARTEKGRTALGIAAMFGQVDCARILAQRGASISAVTTDRWSTPLHDAVERNQVGAVDFLISIGADATVKNKHGQTALGIATVSLRSAMLIALSTPAGRTSPESGARRMHRRVSSDISWAVPAEFLAVELDPDPITILEAGDVELEGLEIETDEDTRIGLKKHRNDRQTSISTEKAIADWEETPWTHSHITMSPKNVMAQRRVSEPAGRSRHPFKSDRARKNSREDRGVLENCNPADGHRRNLDSPSPTQEKRRLPRPFSMHLKAARALSMSSSAGGGSTDPGGLARAKGSSPK